MHSHVLIVIQIIILSCQSVSGMFLYIVDVSLEEGSCAPKGIAVHKLECKQLL